MGRLSGQGVETDVRRLRQADHSERQGRTEEQRSWVFKRERLTWGAGMRGLRQWAVCVDRKQHCKGLHPCSLTHVSHHL